MTVEELNRMPEMEAHAVLQRCCCASAWVDALCAGRPYRSLEDLHARAERAFERLDPADWREAFAHHPRVGDLDALRDRFPSTGAWAAEEQKGTSVASDATLASLAEGNRAYERKFGYTFIVCATGKNAAEMLALLHDRLRNEAEREIAIAAEEQMKITRLRLEKLLGSTGADRQEGS